MIKLSCPFCNTTFDVVGLAPSRIACPRCHESVPDTSVAPPDAHAVSVVEGWPREKSSRLWMVGVGIIVLAVAAFIADSLWETKLPPAAPTDTGSQAAATKPPLTLSSLRHLPANSQIVVAIQPAAFAEYTKRKGKSVEIWLDEAGTAGKLMEEFRKLNLAPDQIEQLAIALPANTIAAAFVLVLRKPLADDTDFRNRLQAKPITDKPTHFTVEFFNLPLEMKKVDDTTYRFANASESKWLDAPPAANADHLPQELRDAMGKLSPASFAWVASNTVRPDWGASNEVKILALTNKDAAAYLKGVQAFAFGLATEPELKMTALVRSSDAKAQAAKFTERLGADKAEITAEGDWASAKWSFDPPKDGLAALKALTGP